MSVSINFWIRKSQARKDGAYPIYLALNLEGEKCQITTGITVKEKEWNSKSQSVRKSSILADVKNGNLSTLKIKILKKYNELQLRGEPFNVHMLKDALAENGRNLATLGKVFDEQLDKIESLIGNGYSKPTLVKYISTRERIRDFLLNKHRRNDIYLYELNYKFIEDFSYYLRIAHNNGDTTIYKHYQRVKKIINEAIHAGHLIKDPFHGFKIKQGKSPLVYLTLEELSKIEAKEISNSRLQKVQLLFLFASYTGLSFKELANLTPANYIQEDGANWINMIRQKTGRHYRIVILPQAVEYLNEMRDKFGHEIPKKKLLPQITNQKYNAYLKELGDICGISKNLTSHVARKTFSIGIALRSKVSIELLSALLGHSNIRVTTDYYAKITDEVMLSGIKDLASQLEAIKSQ
jgi:integrase/recombinase XerD